MDTAALSKLLESDIARMQAELNYRLLMTGSLAGTVLWVEEVTVEDVTTEEPLLEETAPSLAVTQLCIKETVKKLPRPWDAILQWLRAHFHK